MKKTDTKDDSPILSISTEKNQLKLNVNKSDAILILGKDCSIQMIIQDIPDDSPVPMNMALISAIATRLNVDPNFSAELIDFIESFSTVSEFGVTSLNKLDFDSTGESKICWN